MCRRCICTSATASATEARSLPQASAEPVHNRDEGPRGVLRRGCGAPQFRRARAGLPSVGGFLGVRGTRGNFAASRAAAGCGPRLPPFALRLPPEVHGCSGGDLEARGRVRRCAHGPDRSPLIQEALLDRGDPASAPHGLRAANHSVEGAVQKRTSIEGAVLCRQRSRGTDQTRRACSEGEIPHRGDSAAGLAQGPAHLVLQGEFKDCGISAEGRRRRRRRPTH
mmetsp:Transcript_118875/g.341423  ORF Transcript_118875/g.341423 Transcript_118875/m.341423 type:complete len:224 (+) Transcript_118875:411-1082(+)